MEGLIPKRSSVHPQFVGEWSAEFDYATSMDDLEHSESAFVSNSMEFETLDSKKCQRTCKISSPTNSGEKLNYWTKKRYKERRTMLTTVRQIMHPIFSFLDSTMTRGRAMSLTDLLNIEMHIYNLKQFNKARRDDSLFRQTMAEDFIKMRTKDGSKSLLS